MRSTLRNAWLRSSVGSPEAARPQGEERGLRGRGTPRKTTALAVVVAWTALVWGGRIRNVLGDDDLSNSDKTWRIVVAAIFLAFAALVAVVAVRSHDRRLVAPERALMTAFVAWTIGWWVVRGTGILLADFTGGFKVVHTVLAVVSIGLALWAGGRTRAGVRSSKGRTVTAGVDA